MLGRTALHAGAGCLSSVAGGGSCKTGALSAAVGELGHNLPVQGRVLGTVKAAMLGGISSKIAGGKFSDGATTGAFGHLFNACAHGECGASPEENGAPVGKGKEAAPGAPNPVGDLISACGLAVGPCRALDAGIGATNAAIDLFGDGDGRAAAATAAGESGTRVVDQGMKAANTHAKPHARMPKSFREAFAYGAGKITEILFSEHQKKNASQ